MDGKKILFLTSSRWMVSTFWNAVCERKCREYGFFMEMPARDGDLAAPDWQSRLAEYDAIVTTWGSPVCSEHFLSGAKKLRVLGHCAGSVAAVADATTFRLPIHVTTANPIMAEGVAEWSLLATLLVQRNLTVYAKLRGGEKMNWNSASAMSDLKQMTIGLWGLGDTTRHLLRFLTPLAPGRILICSNHSSAGEIAALGGEKATLEELLHESDVFHCLVGVSKETCGRLGAAEFAMMKSGAVFVNGGRARLTREDELLEELKTGRIRAILDVFNEEPLPENSPFLALDNVILTPHNAGFPGRERFLPFLLDEFHRFFSGEKMRSEISGKRFLTMTDEKMRV